MLPVKMQKLVAVSVDWIKLGEVQYKRLRSKNATDKTTTTNKIKIKHTPNWSNGTDNFQYLHTMSKIIVS